MNTVPKAIGSDTELGNFISGVDDFDGACADAARLLLRQFDGFDRGGWSGSFYWQHSQDWGRKFLPATGGCAYIDLNHLEVCTPE